MNTSVAKYFIYPAFTKITRPEVLEYLKFLREYQWLPLEELRLLQLNSLKKLLDFAVKYSSFYRERIGAYYKTRECNSPFDLLESIPVLTKDQIQEERGRILCRNSPVSRYFENHTGGSTGKMLTFFQDSSYDTWRIASELLAFEWLGFKTGDRIAKIWGSQEDISGKRNFRVAISSWLMNRRFLNAFGMTEKSMMEFFKTLSSFRPKILMGYATALKVFANFLKNNGLNLPSPEAVISTAETIFEEDRKLLAEVFHCHVINRYGCREVGLIAQECPEQHNLHIFSLNNIVEILDRERMPVDKNHRGNVVITNINNHIFPFIRYNIEDIAVKGADKCGCGRSFPVLESVLGRDVDLLLTPEGEIVDGEFFTHIFYGVPGIKQYQLIQRSLYEIIIKIVKTDAFEMDLCQSIEDKIRRKFGRDLKLSFQFIESIPIPSSGKYRFCISNIGKLDSYRDQ
ncbi:MAG: phenylacetate--CoA ligase family protein [Fidelibacterota bacterium]